MTEPLRRARAAMSAGDWPTCFAHLRTAAAAEDGSSAQALHLLGAMHHGATGDPRVALDVDASARAYAGCLQMLLRDASRAGAPRASASPLFFDATHACKAAVTEREVPPDSEAWAAVCAALRAVSTACDAGTGVGAADFDAAVVAWFGLAQAAFSTGDRAAAARRYRRALAVAARGGSAANTHARGCAEGSASNLAVLEAPPGAAKAAANAAVCAGEDASRVDVRTYDVRTLPACAACGATPLALKKCGGTCGGAARYCDAVCYAAHVKQHMRESGCKKVK
jgi:hypothetical protein